jgi:hypothetical protein
VHLNGSAAQKRPPAQHSPFGTSILSLPVNGQSDWPKHVAGLNKYYCTKVVFCVAWYCRQVHQYWSATGKTLKRKKEAG